MVREQIAGLAPQSVSITVDQLGHMWEATDGCFSPSPPPRLPTSPLSKINEHILG